MPHELPPLARDAIAAWLKMQRWFGGKGRAIESLRMGAVIPIGNGGRQALRLLHVDFAGSEEETYWIAWPMNWRAEEVRGAADVPAELTGEADFLAALWEECAMGKSSVWRHPDWQPSTRQAPQAALANFEQSNTCAIFRPAESEPAILKLYRKLTPGANPDAELGRYLSEQANPVTPPLHAVLEVPLGEQSCTLGILSRFLPDCRTAWDVLLEMLAVAWQIWIKAEPDREKRNRAVDLAKTPAGSEALWNLQNEEINLSNYSLSLGFRTAQLHNDLAKGAEPDLRAEAWNRQEFTAYLQQQSEYARKQLAHLRQCLSSLHPETAANAIFILEHEAELIGRYSEIEHAQNLGKRMRIHGDYHLGQVLVAAKPPYCDEIGLPTYKIDQLPDYFWIIDFEGEPSRSLNERLAKLSALQDVAGMIRSFHYALCMTQFNLASNSKVTESQQLQFHEIATVLVDTFLIVYRNNIYDKSIIPQDDAQFQKLLDFFILDKALYELGYELNNRPDWVQVPLMGIAELLENPM